MCNKLNMVWLGLNPPCQGCISWQLVGLQLARDWTQELALLRKLLLKWLNWRVRNDTWEWVISKAVKFKLNLSSSHSSHKLKLYLYYNVKLLLMPCVTCLLLRIFCAVCFDNYTQCIESGWNDGVYPSKALWIWIQFQTSIISPPIMLLSWSLLLWLS